MIRRSLAAVAVSLAFAGAANAATNLVTNGSFEADPLGVAWTKTCTSFGGPGTCSTGFPVNILTYNQASAYPIGAFGESVPPDNSASISPDPVGDHAAYFVADNSIETLSQSVFFTPGRYAVGFSVFIPRNGFNNPIDATFDGSIATLSVANFSAKSSGLTARTWMHQSGELTIGTAGFYDVTFTYDSRRPANYNGPNNYAADFVIDRVYAMAIPEPSTWAIMIVGFGGAGAMIRSNRRRAVAA